MSEENKQLVHRWFEEVWNKGRAEAIEEMFDANGIAHGLSDDPANPIKGPGNFRPFHTLFREAFPNMEIVVEDTVAAGHPAGSLAMRGPIPVIASVAKQSRRPAPGGCFVPRAVWPAPAQ